jgi:CheY-like chemotaxis protein
MTLSPHDGNGAEAERPLVLVVDDLPDICEVIRAALEEGGSFRVSCAGSSGEALPILEGMPPPDLAVIDMLMPGEPGIRLATRAAELGVPTVLMTGDLKSIDALEELEYPILCKPFRLAALLAAAQEAIARSGAHRAPSRERRAAVAENLRAVTAACARLQETTPRSHGAATGRLQPDPTE